MASCAGGADAVEKTRETSVREARAPTVAWGVSARRVVAKLPGKPPRRASARGVRGVQERQARVPQGSETAAAGVEVDGTPDRCCLRPIRKHRAANPSSGASLGAGKGCLRRNQGKQGSQGRPDSDEWLSRTLWVPIGLTSSSPAGLEQQARGSGSGDGAREHANADQRVGRGVDAKCRHARARAPGPWPKAGGGRRRPAGGCLAPLPLALPAVACRAGKTGPLQVQLTVQVSLPHCGRAAKYAGRVWSETVGKAGKHQGDKRSAGWPISG